MGRYCNALGKVCTLQVLLVGIMSTLWACDVYRNQVCVSYMSFLIMSHTTRVCTLLMDAEIIEFFLKYDCFLFWPVLTDNSFKPDHIFTIPFCSPMLFYICWHLVSSAFPPTPFLLFSSRSTWVLGLGDYRIDGQEGYAFSTCHKLNGTVGCLAKAASSGGTLFWHLC